MHDRLVINRNRHRHQDHDDAQHDHQFEQGEPQAPLATRFPEHPHSRTAPRLVHAFHSISLPVLILTTLTSARPDPGSIVGYLPGYSLDAFLYQSLYFVPSSASPVDLV